MGDGLDGRAQPSQEWLQDSGLALSAFAIPRLQPSTVQLVRDLGVILDAFARSVDETAPPIRTRFARLAQRLSTTVLTPQYLAMLEQVHDQRPTNWPNPVKLDTLVGVIRDDGIPLVWVPRPELVERVLVGPDRQARIEVLSTHRHLVIQDCRDILASVTATALANRVPLARAAVDALADGHPEAAQALATVVTESVVAATMSRDYAKVRQQVLDDVTALPYDRMRLVLALAPIYLFYTPWFASWGTPAPAALSRHVSVHNADTAHYTDGNALVAVMLVCSVLRAFAEPSGLEDA